MKIEKTEPAYDVIVIGGGPAGIVAATQAARAGARTLLVEKSAMLGGSTTLNGVNFPGLFHAWGRQVVAGIGWELVTAAVRENGDRLPDFSAWHDLPHYRLQILVNGALYAALADELVLGSGAELRFHTLLASVRFERDVWQLQLCGKEGLSSVRASVLLDCTGDANAVALAGFPLVRETTLQPGTLVTRAGGYDFEHLDHDALEAAFLDAVRSGSMRRSDFQAANRPVATFLRLRGGNSMHVTGVDGSSSEGKSRAEVRARATLLRIIRFLRAQPGLEKFHIEHMAAECGIRETVTIVGEARVTREDYVTGRVWPDAVCHSFYPIDLHVAEGGAIDTRPLRPGVVPTIPLGALLPRDSRRLLVAGRCACGDREANSAFRVQASAMAMGQAAGAAAALAARGGTDPREIPLEEIHALLARHGAVVPRVPTAATTAAAAA